MKSRIMYLLLNTETTVLAGFNEFGFNESSRLNELVFDLKYFFCFINTSDLTNNRV